MLFAARTAERDKKAQHETAHALLQQYFSVYAESQGIHVCEPLQLAYSDAGKPHLVHYPQVHFSLSHCAGLAVCMFSQYHCGIDAEPVQRVRDGVVRRAYSDAEREALAVSEHPDELFTRLWTLKESYVKAIGTGISYPLREVSFRITGHSAVSLAEGADFYCLPETEHFFVSACVLR